MPDPQKHIGPNTFLKYHAVQYYIVFSPISQWWRITFKIKLFSYPDPDSHAHQNRMNSSMPHTQLLHQVSAESVHNFFRYRAIYLFSPISQWWRINENNYQIHIWIGIFTKIEAILPCHTPNMSTKFHPNPFTTFWDIVLYISFVLSLNGEESMKKILVFGSGLGSSPKSNQFVLVTHPTCPPNFIQIHPPLLEISCTQTDRQEWKHNPSTFGAGGKR